jgi:hypothetical protein
MYWPGLGRGLKSLALTLLLSNPAGAIDLSINDERT